MNQDIGSLLQTDALTTSAPFVFSHSCAVNVVRISFGGRFVAYGDDAGYVTIRELSSLDRRSIVADAGAPIRDLLWHPSLHGTLLVAAGNGIINAIQLWDSWASDSSILTENVVLRAIKVRGLVNSLSMDAIGGTLAIAFDNKVQICPYPFPDHSDSTAIQADGPFLPLKPPQPELKHNGGRRHPIPVKYYPVPLRVHFLSAKLVCVAFLTGALGYQKKEDSGEWEFVWSIPAQSGSGSTAISPSKTLLAASNLTTGIDWYSIPARRFQMTTRDDLGFSRQNYILDTEFLDETTVITGHNFGFVAIASRGNEGFARILGAKSLSPSQRLSSVLTNSRLIIVAASGSNVTMWFLTPNTTTLSPDFFGDLKSDDGDVRSKQKHTVRFKDVIKDEKRTPMVGGSMWKGKAVSRSEAKLTKSGAMAGGSRVDDRGSHENAADNDDDDDDTERGSKSNNILVTLLWKMFPYMSLLSFFWLSVVWLTKSGPIEHPPVSDQASPTVESQTTPTPLVSQTSTTSSMTASIVAKPALLSLPEEGAHNTVIDDASVIVITETRLLTIFKTITVTQTINALPT